MPEKIGEATKYLVGVIGTLGGIIVALVAYFGRRVIETQAQHDARLDMAEKHIATNARDLHLLRREHDRELERCHKKNEQGKLQKSNRDSVDKN